MQSVKVLVVLLALSQVECAPPSIWPAHRFSPPALWPFKQPSAPSSLFFSTHFPGSTSAPSKVSLPAEEVVSEPVVDIASPVIAEFIPEESVIPAEVFVIPEEPAFPAETFVPEVVEVESVPQLQAPVVSTSENVVLVQEVTAAPVTDIPVEASTTTTVAPPSFQDSDTFKAYEQFINTWLTTASITLNRPDLLSMLTHTKPKTIKTEKLAVKQTVEKSTEKSVEKVVEHVTVSESFEPKKVSGPLKKTPTLVELISTTESPIIVDIAVTDAKHFATTEPIPSLVISVPFEPLEPTIVASDLTPESLTMETVATPELIVFDPIPDNSPVQEQAITEVFETISENPLDKEQIITEVELIEVPSSLQPVATPELIALEPIPENLPIQQQTITEVDLVAEPSILQPVVSQSAVEEFVLAAEPQLTESSYSRLAVSADGTVMVAPNPPASSNVAQPSLVFVAPEPAQPRVLETFTPEGLTYTLQLYPKQGSSFFYSHTLGG